MSKEKVSVPKGTRDFSPQEMIRRNYIFDHIESVFKQFGYLPIETPAMEHLSTLTGKYGDEGDKLLFKLLNSGDFMRKVDLPEEQRSESSLLTPYIAEKGLRYDLTVPFARYVVQHRNDINFPFKRYQIQPVWRADKPQKGRYREFYQCDVDVIGSDSLLNEAELMIIIDRVFQLLNINVTTKFNNRKILSGIAEALGIQDKFTEMTVVIDKLDKIGLEKVCSELEARGIDGKAIESLKEILTFRGSNAQKIDFLADTLKNSKTGTEGVEEVKAILQFVGPIDFHSDIELDITLARGLNYYTGAIFEVKARDVEIGSICGGGRYDNLTGVFGMEDVSGVGVSFGADRIYDVLTQLDAFPEEITTSTQVLFVNFGQQEQAFCFPVVQQLRDEGIRAEIYPHAAKMKKQMSYANNKNIPYVVLVGQNEMIEGFFTLKNMITGEQSRASLDEIKALF